MAKVKRICASVLLYVTVDQESKINMNAPLILYKTKLDGPESDPPLHISHCNHDSSALRLPTRGSLSHGLDVNLVH
jgi:hypothetical protein